MLLREQHQGVGPPHCTAPFWDLFLIALLHFLIFFILLTSSVCRKHLFLNINKYIYQHVPRQKSAFTKYFFCTC